MRIVVVILLLAVSPLVQAEINIFVGAWSTHPGSDYDYNERHDLAAIQYKDYAAGYFKNSFGNDTFFAGRVWSKETRHLDLSVTAGAMHGYADCVRGKAYEGDDRTRLCPMVSVAASYTEFRIQPTVMIIGKAVAVSIRVAI